jgi:hypothetical protein
VRVLDPACGSGNFLYIVSLHAYDRSAAPKTFGVNLCFFGTGSGLG